MKAARAGGAGSFYTEESEGVPGALRGTLKPARLDRPENSYPRLDEHLSPFLRHEIRTPAAIAAYSSALPAFDHVATSDISPSSSVTNAESPESAWARLHISLWITENPLLIGEPE